MQTVDYRNDRARNMRSKQKKMERYRNRRAKENERPWLRREDSEEVGVLREVADCWDHLVFTHNLASLFFSAIPEAVTRYIPCGATHH